MSTSRVDMLAARLAKNTARFAKHFAREATDCYRVYDHDIPELPFTVDRYAGHAVLTEVPGRHARTDAEHARFLEDVEAAVADALEIPRDHVVSKRRVRRLAGQQWEREDEAPVRAVVQERGTRFHVALTGKIDTGLFLDHRNLRRRVEESIRGRSLLNLFCYTGAFTVCAAKGGAAHTMSVDLSSTALTALDENLALNGLTDRDKHVSTRADCLAHLAVLARAPHRFDWIVLDPPSASKSKAAEGDLDVQRDHVRLVEQCAALLAPGGVLAFSTNLRSFVLDERLARALSLVEITKESVPIDFRGRPHRTFLHTRR